MGYVIRHLFKKKTLLLTVLLLSMVFVSGLYVLDLTKSIYEAHASEIIEFCEGSEFRPGCYNDEIPKLMDQGLTMEEVFTVVRTVRERDAGYPFCHTLGHYVGAREVAKDPTLWKTVIARADNDVCFNGVVHGAFQERFRLQNLEKAPIEVLRRELEGVCDIEKGADTTRREQGACHHGLGHALLFLTNADVVEALELCDRLSFRGEGYDFRRLCHDGVLMQLFRPLEPEDALLIEGKEIITKEEAKVFCATFSGDWRVACVTESWKLFIDELDTSDELFSFCSPFSENTEHEKWCYYKVPGSLFIFYNFDRNVAENLCSGLPPTQAGYCFSRFANKLVDISSENIPQAISYCESRKSREIQEYCYQDLMGYLSYYFRQPSGFVDTFWEVCTYFPGRWEDTCLNWGRNSL